MVSLSALPHSRIDCRDGRRRLPRCRPQGCDALQRGCQMANAHDEQDAPMAECDETAHCLFHRGTVIERHLIEAAWGDRAVDHDKRRAGAGDRVQRLVRSKARHQDEAADAVVQQRHYALMLDARILMAQDLHDFEAAAGGDILEGVDQLGEISDRGMRHAQPDHGRAPAPQPLGQGVLRVGQFLDGLVDTLPAFLTDRDRTIENVGDGADRHARLPGDVQNGRALVVQSLLRRVDDRISRLLRPRVNDDRPPVSRI